MRFFCRGGWVCVELFSLGYSANRQSSSHHRTTQHNPLERRQSRPYKQTLSRSGRKELRYINVYREHQRAPSICFTLPRFAYCGRLVGPHCSTGPPPPPLPLLSLCSCRTNSDGGLAARQPTITLQEARVQM